MHFGARHRAGIDSPFKFEIGIGLNRTSGANRGDSARQIQPWEAVSHLSEDHVAHGIKEVVMHADQPRNYGVFMEIEHLGIPGDLGGRGIAHRLNFPLIENDRLIVPRGGPGSIDDAHVCERGNRCIELQKFPHFWRERLPGSTAKHQK